MDKIIKISWLWIWMVVLLLCLIGVLLLQSWVTHQVSVSLTPEVLTSESVSKKSGFTGEVSKEKSSASLSGEESQTINPEITGQKTLVTNNLDQTVPSPSMQPLQNQVEQQEVNPSAVIPINAPMTDQQILEGIQQQNQKQQAIQQITDNRNAEAVQVMRNAEVTQSQSENNQQVISSDHTVTLPPADIVAKLKSHQFTAH